MNRDYYFTLSNYQLRRFEVIKIDQIMIKYKVLSLTYHT